MIKTGAGTLTLNSVSASNYTGLTMVNQGTLNLASNLSQSGVAVSAGATLSGNGAIGGSLTLDVGSKVNLSSNIGNLTVTGNYIWNGAASNLPTSIFQLSNTDNAADRIAVGGDFTKGSGTTFQFDFTSTGFGVFDTPEIYTLITFGGTTDFTAGDFSYINLADGHHGLFNIGSGALTFTVIPEPAEYALALGAVTLLIAVHRRRKRA